MSCAGKACTARVVRIENPDFSHPFDDPKSTFVVKRSAKVVYNQLVYDKARAEYESWIKATNAAAPVKDSCPGDCECEVEYEKRASEKRITLPQVSISISVKVTGQPPTTVNYTATTTADEVVYVGKGVCAERKRSRR
jgi:hypothetical protein